MLIVTLLDVSVTVLPEGSTAVTVTLFVWEAPELPVNSAEKEQVKTFPGPGLAARLEPVTHVPLPFRFPKTSSTIDVMTTDWLEVLVTLTLNVNVPPG